MDLLLVFNMFMLVIFILLGIAFFTLLERKVLGYMQIRKGPNKVGVVGLLQPFSDAMKLLSKEMEYLKKFNYFPFFVSPMVALFLMMMAWSLFPVVGGGMDFFLGILFFLSCLGFSVYVLFGCGWASNAKYSMLGALRGVAQSISYEVSMALILLSGVILIGLYDLYEYFMVQKYVSLFLLMVPLFFCWVMSCMAEANRTPFDFAEGESELVSGFNTEYSGGPFTFLFLAEYGMMMFMSMFSEIIYFGYENGKYIMIIFFMFIFLWMRASMPRYRYDKLMYLAWKSYLPVALNYLVYFVGLMVFLFW